MLSKSDHPPHPHRPSSPWLWIGLIISLTLVFIQFLTTISRPGLVYRGFSREPYNECSLLMSNTKHQQQKLEPTLNLIKSNKEEDETLTIMNELPTFSSIRVVSLKSRQDRRDHMESLRDFLGYNKHQNIFHFSDAILYDDPKVLEIVKRIGNHTKADKKIAEVGHVACRLSHQIAIKAADDNDDETTLILEDDVDMEAAFKYLSGTILRDVPNDWDIIFFGHTDFSDESRHGRDPRTNNFFIYKSVEPQGGHGYALSRKGRKLVLDLLENKRPEVYETDEGQPIDEIFVYLARLHRATLYSIIPDLIVQVPLFKSDIFGTPAGFEDGMHNKKLLDSTLNRIKSKANHQPVTSSTTNPPHSPVVTGIAHAHRFKRDSNLNHHHTFNEQSLRYPRLP